MFCNNCGSQVNAGDKFCNGCGNKIGGAPIAPQGQAAAPQTAAPVTSPVAPKQQGKMPAWLKVIIGIGIFIVLIVWVAFSATSGVVKTVEKHLDLLKQGDLRAAYNLTTSKDFRDATSFEQFAMIVQRFPAMRNTKKYSFNERNINSDGTGSAKGILTAADGTATPIIFKLIKENGQWKIISFTVNPNQF